MHLSPAGQYVVHILVACFHAAVSFDMLAPGMALSETLLSWAPLPRALRSRQPRKRHNGIRGRANRPERLSIARIHADQRHVRKQVKISHAQRVQSASDKTVSGSSPLQDTQRV